MPHIIVEYSNNLEPACSAAGLLQSVHQVALESGIFDPGAVRTRAAPRSLYLVGKNTDPAAGFIHITARVRPGRTTATLDIFMRALMEATERYLQAADYSAPLMVNVEIHELPTLRLGAQLRGKVQKRNGPT